MTTIEIRHDLNVSRLDLLSEEMRDAADESGELDGNSHYNDLSVASWNDVAHALVSEASLIHKLEASSDPAAEERAIYEARDGSEDRDVLWHLDVGVAAAVMALNALGAHTVLSCNGAEFGGTHFRDYPSIRFFPHEAEIDELLDLARNSGVGLVEEDGRALLYGRTVRDLQCFAALALERSGVR